MDPSDRLAVPALRRLRVPRGRLMDSKSLLWLVFAVLIATTIGLVIVVVMSVPEGPPAYGYDCDSAYRLKEANCPQDR